MQDANLERVRHRKINHLLFMDDLKLYWNSKKEAERVSNTVNIFLKDIAMEFGILEANNIIHTEMKDKIQKEYYKRETADIIETEWWKYN